MVLETLGVGLVIPVLALVNEPDIAVNYPFLNPILETLDHPSRFWMIAGAMLGLVLFYTIKSMFLFYLAWEQPKFAFGVGAKLSQLLFRGYLHQPYTFHLQRNSAQLINNAMHEVGVLAQNGLIASMGLLTESCVLVGIVVLMLWVEPTGTLVVSILLGLAIWVYQQQTHSRILRWGESRQHHEGMRIQCLQQGLGGAKDVKLLGREQDFFDQYAYHNAKTARAQRLQNVISNLPRLWLEWFTVIAMAALVLSMLVQGKPTSALVPILGLFAAATFRLMPSVNRTLTHAQNLRYALPVIHHVHAEVALFKNTPEILPSDKQMPFKSEIEIRNLDYAYPKAFSFALKNISLSIPKGSSVGFIGSSGAGKSTFIDVILGLLTPARGQILVDGQDIQSDLRSWQNLTGYVPQSIYLTDDTLRRNVAFGLANEQINEEAVQRSIRAAQLDRFVADLPQGLDTLVGERGIRLSGGQRQRIGIARALYHDPSVLVLDEATSSLDTETEQGVMEAVKALQGDKTILIVAHRLSTVAHCKCLYRLECGELVREQSIIPSSSVVIPGLTVQNAF
ncbi:MAG: ABC transporter ATP-binding protein [Deltaproteobacteria bacterium]|nr:ABC transporter ATP-binding protein [Deltaproteobacteria bacterium]